MTYETGSIEEFAPQNVEAFDAVVSSEVLEHVNDVPRFITDCVKCLKPGGSIVFTTINRTFLAKFYYLWVLEDATGIIPRGTHEYKKLVKPSLIEEVLKDSKLITRNLTKIFFFIIIYFISDNCSTEAVRGLLFNILTKKWSWINSNACSYALHGVKKQN